MTSIENKLNSKCVIATEIFESKNQNIPYAKVTVIENENDENEEIADFEMLYEWLHDDMLEKFTPLTKAKIPDLAKYLETTNANIKDDLINVAIDLENVELLLYANENVRKCDEESCSNAAFEGQLKMLKIMHEGGCPWDDETCAASARKGHLNCLKYAVENNCPLYPDTLVAAAHFGHLECFKYAYEHGCKLSKEISINAAGRGNLELLDYARDIGCEFPNDICCFPIVNGDVKCLEYLIERGYKTTEAMSIEAVFHNNLNIISFMNDNNLPISKDICSHAAKHGFLPILKYLHKHDFEKCDNVCGEAAKHGHLDCLIYAHKNFFPIVDSFAFAAKYNQMDCLKYAHKNEFPSKYVCKSAAAAGNIECFDFLVGKGYQIEDSLDLALHNNKFEMFKHIYFLKPCTLKRSSDLNPYINCVSLLDDILRCNNIKFVRFVHEQGYQFTSNDIKYMCWEYGDIECIKFVLTTNIYHIPNQLYNEINYITYKIDPKFYELCKEYDAKIKTINENKARIGREYEMKLKEQRKRERTWWFYFWRWLHTDRS